MTFHKTSININLVQLNFILNVFSLKRLRSDLNKKVKKHNFIARILGEKQRVENF